MTGRNKEIDIVFDRDIKDSVIDNVLKKAKESIHLKQLRKNFSAEGGFEFPITNYWNRALTDNLLYKYHNARQIRFIHERKNITGLRLKDSIPY